MSKAIKHPIFFHKKQGRYADGWGSISNESRRWEDAYRDRWAHDKIVRSTHGVNCTGSCSWMVYVKDGIVTWETQATDYPPTPCGVPNHEPRGCPRGASYSWYLYSGTRIKHPLVRAELLSLWRGARKTKKPIDAWKSIVEAEPTRRLWVSARGRGGFVRASWDECTEMIAAANLYTAETYGPDRVAGFAPIPAYSMVSYGVGTRYLSLFGGTALSFYEWYCDLPPSSPQTWGEQTDVPESEAWFYSSYLIVWGTNILMTRTPDAHFLTEARYHGTKVVNICPDYCETTKDADWWLHPRQGTDAALAMAMVHVIFKEFHLEHPDPYFSGYIRNFTDMPTLVMLDADGDVYTAGRTLRLSDIKGEEAGENAAWKPMVWDKVSKTFASPAGSIGYRWPGEEGEAFSGRWNLKSNDGETGTAILPKLTMENVRDDVVDVVFPYFGGNQLHLAEREASTQTMVRRVPVKTAKLADGSTAPVTTVFDLLAAYLGIDRGLGGECADSYDDIVPFTPAWQEAITGVAAADAVTLAREFANAASRTQGRASVAMGSGVNQWYQTDNTYRAIIFMLMLCGTCGVPGGGWCHYVGQEKIRPEAGWSAFSFAKDWVPASRQMNTTSYFYEHADQWRYERIPLSDMLSPLADAAPYGSSYLDCNVQSVMMGWLPTSPQIATNPVALAAKARAAGKEPADYVADALSSRSVKFSVEDIDAPENWPRNLIVWRSNLLGASGKGQEYFFKHLLGAEESVIGPELGADEAALRPSMVAWRDAPIGKLDLLVNIDFRMSTTGLYSDIVLPAATFYEKDDINTTDMHSFIHPFVKAVSAPWEAESDWNAFKLIAEAVAKIATDEADRFSAVEDVVLMPLGHDSASELGQPLDVRRWFEGECDFIPGKTAPHIQVIKRDYRQIYDQLTSVGPRLDAGGGNRGITWSLDEELTELGNLNGRRREGAGAGRPKLETAVDAANFILRTSPETNGSLAWKSWDFVEKQTGQDCRDLSANHRGDKLTFGDLAVRPQKTFTAPDWSGTENDETPYVAFVQNVERELPWRTLTGRQHFYQDHQWMRDFGQAFPQYRPPADQRNTKPFENLAPNGSMPIRLNLITAHQKWGIHSTYFENERMLSLSRGGPVLWINQTDAENAGIADNDWVEGYNGNGAVIGRAIVSARLPQGLAIMMHATEKTVNMPASEVTGHRGGGHNAPTRILVNPTHMIGGYAQLSYSFNYYGTICPNRDDWIWVRKMVTIDWAEEKQGASGLD